MKLLFGVVALFLELPSYSYARGVSEVPQIFRGIIPFSTKYPQLIIPDESRCLPRRDCSKTRTTPLQNNDRLAWTDLENELPKEVGDDPLSGPVELPAGAEDQEDLLAEDQGELQAVVAEEDNFLIEQCERTCPKDQADYCDEAGKNGYLGPEHTMCKFCGLGEKCPYYQDPAKNDLTGRVIRDYKVQELIVQHHNEIRSKIARGACGQPKAGCMGPLVWDDELARVAQKWADQCADVDYKGDYKRQDPSLFHDPHPQRKVEDFSDWRGVGQNVARDIARGSAGQFNATSLVGHWFAQIKLFDPQGVKSFGNGDQCSLGVGYYTQLVWENTTHVGCGWTQFQYRGFPGYFENFLVCNYGPAANIWKDPVYTIAETTCDCPCVDCDQEAGMCPANPRYGSWSSWGEWGRCTRSCGGGQRDRKRACTAPTEDGKAREPCPLCDGTASETDKCNIRSCPEWTPWSPWSECSVSCGDGDRSRSRVCGDGTEDEGACPGEPIEYATCSPGACPAWTPWTTWSSCTATCGGGKRRRLRQCGVERKLDCVGPPEEEEDCNTQSCPAWTEWSEWTECTQSCGGGKKTKVRECVFPKSASGLCEGEREVSEICNANKCPDWTPWAEWSPCTKSCGGGTTTRQRECEIPSDRAGGVEGCVGEPQEEDQCNQQECPIWTEWSEWTDCSLTCGGGEQSRSRECVLPKGVEGCSGDSQEKRECNSAKCPVWTEWTEWTDCTATCGGGTRYKVRECVLPDVRGVLQCPGADKMTETCNAHECPVLTPWGEWTECSSSCDGGTRFKRRECVYPGSEKTKSVATNDCREQLEAQETCNEQKCPEFGEWSDWTECTKTCGGGRRKKVRECVLPKNVGGCIGDSEVEETCNNQECPVWTEWTEWTECSATCGGGRQNRNRKCVLPESRAYLCAGDDSEERECNSDNCPDWTPWTDWSSCTKSCGGGSRTKLRECVLTRGLQCTGESEVKEDCNTDKCPVWTEWTDWTQCTQTCGGGKRTKVRECILPKSAGGCDGESEVSEDCNETKCPAWSEWTEWTECSKSCGGGSRRRGRDCVLRSGLGCEGDTEEVEGCNLQGCPGWSPWSEWTNCTEPCGGGFTERERQCLVDGVRCICEEDKLCSGNFKEGETCNEEACAKWARWSPWTPCSATCGRGSQTRTRQCTGLGSCPGSDSEVQECKERSCVSWSPWGSWGSCSVTCGRGQRSRSRTCGSGVRYLTSCPGDERENEQCDQGPCSSWSGWGGWTGCSATCGTGTRSRARECTTDSQDTRNKPIPACLGEREEQEKCQNGPCKGWSSWGSWGTCSTTCGSGTRTRERTCKDIQNTRLGLLTSPCGPGPTQDRGACSSAPCTTTPPPTQAPSTDCGGKKMPTKFFAFNGRPAKNIADCSWDYFGCVRRFEMDCCMLRYKQCCMQVMGVTTTTTIPPPTTAGGGYGPQIDIDLDIDLGNLENPIDDIDLGEGTGVDRPEFAASVAEVDEFQNNEITNNFVDDSSLSTQQLTGYYSVEEDCARLARNKKGNLLPNPSDCTRFISCQRSGGSTWIGNPMSCPTGTGFDQEIQSCNHVTFIKGCNTARRAKILEGFSEEQEYAFKPMTMQQQLQQLQQLTSNNIQAESLLQAVYAKQTKQGLNVADGLYLTSSSVQRVYSYGTFAIFVLILLN